MLKPPSLEPWQVPSLGELFLIKVNLLATPDWEHVPTNKQPPLLTQFGLCVLPPSEDHRVQVQLSAKIMANEEADERPSYTGELLVGADVLFPPGADLDQETLMQSAAWLAVGILVGEVRGHVRMLTAVGPNPEILLCEVNVRSAIASAVRPEFNADGEGGMTYVKLYPDADEAADGATPSRANNKRTKRKRPGGGS